jgi:hypothetical protein
VVLRRVCGLGRAAAASGQDLGGEDSKRGVPERNRCERTLTVSGSAGGAAAAIAVGVGERCERARARGGTLVAAS